jgi:AcrR family transcriptional regulator
MAKRKTDRRTLMTKDMIKDGLLSLLESLNYEKISISGLCKKVEITRATFYAHYTNLDEVLEEVLDDALKLTDYDHNPLTSQKSLATVDYQQENPDELLPACQRAASHPKYRILFMNESVSPIILNKLYHREKDHQIATIMARWHVNKEDATVIFIYTLYGSFVVNKFLGWEKNEKWYHTQALIQKFFAPKND